MENQENVTLLRNQMKLLSRRAKTGDARDICMVTSAMQSVVGKIDELGASHDAENKMLQDQVVLIAELSKDACPKDLAMLTETMCEAMRDPFI